MRRHIARPPQTVFRASVSVVKPPFVDGALVEHRELGLYSTLDSALAWIRSPEFRELFDEEEHETPLRVGVAEHALDVGPHSYDSFRGHVLLSPSGEVLERTARGDGELPWAGRDPATYRWRRGAIAACVDNGRYRIGVVLAPPPSIDWLRRRGGEVTRMDDVSLLGFAGDNFDHDHPSDAEMFEPLVAVPEELRLLLDERLRGYHFAE